MNGTASANSDSVNSTPAGSSTGPRADSLVGSLALMLGLAIVQRGLGFVREILFCRWFDEHELGQWAMAFAFLMGGAAVIALGIQGSMNRYVEYYRQRGQLRAYLRRVMFASTCLGIAGTAAVILFPHAFSEFIFARPDCIAQTQVVAVGLAIVLANNLLVDLFAALRMFRHVSLMHALNGLGFVVLGIAAAALAGPRAIYVITAFCASFMLSISVAFVLARRVWRTLPEDTSPLVDHSFWPTLIRASLPLWVYNCLVNTQDRIDQYMILHASGLEHVDALALVGNYHTARVIPYILFTLAVLVASTVMPYLSHDWERGRRAEVGRQVISTFKMAGLAFFAMACSVLVVAPFVFELGFLGKYATGRQVMPTVLAQCLWSGLAVIVFNYLWCAEKLRLVVVALVVTIVVNVSLNQALVGPFGLAGVAAAVAVASLTLLSLAGWFSHVNGLPLDRGVALVALLPATLPAGPIVALPALAIALILLRHTSLFLSFDEKQWLLEKGQRVFDRLRPARRSAGAVS